MRTGCFGPCIGQLAKISCPRSPVHAFVSCHASSNVSRGRPLGRCTQRAFMLNMEEPLMCRCHLLNCHLPSSLFDLSGYKVIGSSSHAGARQLVLAAASKGSIAATATRPMNGFIAQSSWEQQQQRRRRQRRQQQQHVFLPITADADSLQDVVLSSRHNKQSPPVQQTTEGVSAAKRRIARSSSSSGSTGKRKTCASTVNKADSNSNISSNRGRPTTSKAAAQALIVPAASANSSDVPCRGNAAAFTEAAGSLQSTVYAADTGVLVGANGSSRDCSNVANTSRRSTAASTASTSTSNIATAATAGATATYNSNGDGCVTSSAIVRGSSRRRTVDASSSRMQHTSNTPTPVAPRRRTRQSTRLADGKCTTAHQTWQQRQHQQPDEPDRFQHQEMAFARRPHQQTVAAVAAAAPATSSQAALAQQNELTKQLQQQEYSVDQSLDHDNVSWHHMADNSSLSASSYGNEAAAMLGSEPNSSQTQQWWWRQQAMLLEQAMAAPAAAATLDYTPASPEYTAVGAVEDYEAHAEPLGDATGVSVWDGVWHSPALHSGGASAGSGSGSNWVGPSGFNVKHTLLGVAAQAPQLQSRGPCSSSSSVSSAAADSGPVEPSPLDPPALHPEMAELRTMLEQEQRKLQRKLDNYKKVTAQVKARLSNPLVRGLYELHMFAEGKPEVHFWLQQPPKVLAEALTNFQQCLDQLVKMQEQQSLLEAKLAAKWMKIEQQDALAAAAAGLADMPVISSSSSSRSHGRANHSLEQLQQLLPQLEASRTKQQLHQAQNDE